MRYLLFLSHGEYSKTKGKKLLESSACRTRELAEAIAAYPIALLHIFAYPKPWIRESANIIAEKLPSVLDFTLLADWQHTKAHEEESATILSAMHERAQEHDADASLYIGKGTELYRTAQRAFKEVINVPTHGKLFYFEPGCLLVIDLQEKTSTFFSPGKQ